MPRVIEVFSPRSRQATGSPSGPGSPSGIALSSRAAASVPCAGSVMQMHATVSPVAMPGSHRACCSAVAFRTRMSLTRAVVTMTYAALKSARPTSSAAMPAMTALAS